MENNPFFIVGAQRSGTTYLYKMLDQHPDICMAKPVRPEPKYFLNKNISEINLDDYYKTFYAECTHTQVKGEKSTSYYESEQAAGLIHHFLPNSKIIFVLRNPVYRALSNYSFSRQNNIETRTPKEVFVDKKPIDDSSFSSSVNPFDYIPRGFYHKYLSLYLGYFRPEQVRVIIFENMVNNHKEAAEIYKFIGADPSFQPKDLDKSVNNSDNQNIDIDDSIIDTLYDTYKDANESLFDILGYKVLSWMR